MPRKREQRLRRELRRARRANGELAELAELGEYLLRYVNESYAPNMKEPYSIANRRAEMFEAAQRYRMRRGLRRKIA